MARAWNGLESDRWYWRDTAENRGVLRIPAESEESNESKKSREKRCITHLTRMRIFAATYCFRLYTVASSFSNRVRSWRTVGSGSMAETHTR